MSDADDVAPKHRDYARALRGVLAALGNDFDAVVNLAAETTTAREIDRFMLALLDLFASKNLIRARCEGRFATSVFRPLGVVQSDLTA